MSWWFVFALAATAYGFKVLGLVLVGDRKMPPLAVLWLGSARP